MKIKCTTCLKELPDGFQYIAVQNCRKPFSSTSINLIAYHQEPVINNFIVCSKECLIKYLQPKEIEE